MLAPIKRFALEAEDRLRYHRLARSVLSRYNLWRAGAADGDGQDALVRSIKRCCAAARLAGSDEVEARIQARIVELVRRLVSRPFVTAILGEGNAVPIFRTAILKPCLGPREKGVVFISFESEWVKLLQLADLGKFAEQYTLVIAPSSSPHNPINYVFPAVYPAPLFSLISNPKEQEVLPRISQNLIVVPLYASCWVNPERFQPLPRCRRAFDLIMVANWGKPKRHQVLFSALRKMPKGLKVLLIGQDQDGRSAETILEVARWYGVQNRLTMRTNQRHAEVASALCQSLSSVVLSRREGSCLVVMESLFADAPVALLRGAEIGSRVFIHERTGRFLDEAVLAAELTEFVAQADRYQPRQWAEENVSCYHSTRLLNDILRRHALDSGEHWTQDIAPLEFSPDPQLVRPEDRQRMAAEQQAILSRFGVHVGPAECRPL